MDIELNNSYIYDFGKFGIFNFQFFRMRWIFSLEEVNNSPSYRDNISSNSEAMHITKGISFMTDVATALKFPQITIATASTFVHRFYRFRSLKDDNFYEIAVSSLFLAAKTEETPRRLQEIVKEILRKLQIKENLEKENKKWTELIIYYEESILSTLNFDIVLQHPYSYLTNWVKRLKCFSSSPISPFIIYSTYACVSNSLVLY